MSIGERVDKFLSKFNSRYILDYGGLYLMGFLLYVGIMWVVPLKLSAIGWWIVPLSHAILFILAWCIRGVGMLDVDWD